MDPGAISLPQSAAISLPQSAAISLPQSAAGATVNCVAMPPLPKTVYADGVFDLFHPGHIAFLKKARAAGGPGARLLVGVISDEDARWKRAPLMSHAERLTMVRHCTEVDAVVDDPPLHLTAEFLDAHEIDLVVHGDDSRQEEFFRVPIERGCMAYVPYHRGVSTSQIIDRVLARARAGLTPQSGT